MIVRLRLRLSRLIYASPEYRSLERRFDDLREEHEKLADQLTFLTLSRDLAELERDTALIASLRLMVTVTEMGKEIKALRAQLPARRSDGVFAPRPDSRRSRRKAEPQAR